MVSKSSAWLTRVRGYFGSVWVEFIDFDVVGY